MMINNSANTLSIIKATAIKYIPEGRVLLFGSRAKNISNPDSDYDFLVITPNTFNIRKKRSIKSLIRKELAKLKIPVDILIQSESEINLKKQITGHIIKQVLKEGIVL